MYDLGLQMLLTPLDRVFWQERINVGVNLSLNLIANSHAEARLSGKCGESLMTGVTYKIVGRSNCFARSERIVSYYVIATAFTSSDSRASASNVRFISSAKATTAALPSSSSASNFERP